MPEENLTNETRQEVPSLGDYASRRIRNFSASMNCVSIGTIQEFDSVTQSATISVNFLRVIKGGSTIPSPNDNKVKDRIVEYPPLVKCPVVFLNGGGGALTFPIQQGDTCLILFCDRDLDVWFQTGQTNSPNTERLHDLNDGIALVGIRSLGKNLLNYNMNGVQLQHGLSVVSLEERVKIAVGLNTLKIGLDALCAALLTWVDTHGDSPDAVTKSAVTAAQVLIDGVLK